MMIEKERRGSKKLLFSTHLFWLVRGETRARVEHEGRRKLQALALKCIHRKCNTELHNYYSTVQQQQPLVPLLASSSCIEEAMLQFKHFPKVIFQICWIFFI